MICSTNYCYLYKHCHNFYVRQVNFKFSEECELKYKFLIALMCIRARSCMTNTLLYHMQCCGNSNSQIVQILSKPDVNSLFCTIQQHHATSAFHKAIKYTYQNKIRKSTHARQNPPMPSLEKLPKHCQTKQKPLVLLFLSSNSAKPKTHQAQIQMMVLPK